MNADLSAASLETPKPTLPPVAPVREVTTDYHGTKITDFYRYMEDLKDAGTLGWLKAQSAYAEGAIQTLPGRQSLLERIQVLDKGAPYRISGLDRLAGGAIFYLKQNMDAETRVVCMRPTVVGEEKLVLDPKEYETGGGSHASLEFFCPSPEGKLGVIGVSKGGSEITTIHVRDIAAGRDLPLAIDRIETAYNVPQWLPDGSAFFYSRRQKLPEGAPASDTYKNTIAYLHRIGRPAEDDTAIFGSGLAPEITFAPMDFPSVRTFAGSPYVVGQVHHGDSAEVSLYVAKLDGIEKKPVAWKKVCEPRDGVTAYDVQGDHIYLITSADAPRYQLKRTLLANPDFKSAEVILPEGEVVLLSVHGSKEAVFVNATRNGGGVVVQLDPSGKQAPKQLTLPQGLTGTVSDVSPHFSEIYVTTQSWTKGSALYVHEPGKGSFELSQLQPRGAFDDVPGYVSREVEVASHDGAMVPLSIVHREGLELDGSRPLLLSGYGAYGSIRHVGFSPTSLAWLERGGVLAVAHVRGGGEKGKPWHLGGQKATKPNTWKDFIACAEYLVAQKYTSSGKLAIAGGSAGGILVGRAITERPDLFRAAIIMVGVSDALRMEITENGPPNIEEFGTATTPEGFRALLAMSPLHQVKDGEKYPAVLLTHGLNDRRVDAWMSGKMTARLQAATSSGRPVLLLLDSEAGHGIGSKRSQYQRELADRWSFILWQTGDPEFQPK